MTWYNSNLFMNMGGCGWGNNYAFGSGIAGLFSGVSGINCLFNYGGYGNYGYYDSGCGCSGDNSVNWGHIIGATAAWLLPAVGGAIAGGVQNSKAAEAQADQGFKNALKTLNIPENTKPENLTISMIETAKPDYTKMKNYNTLQTAIDNAEADYQTASQNLKDANQYLTSNRSYKDNYLAKEAQVKELESKLANKTPGVTAADVTKAQEELATLKAHYDEYIQKEKDVQEPDGKLYKAEKEKREKLEKAKKEMENAKIKYDEEFENARTLALNYIKEWQTKLLDNADGTRVSRTDKDKNKPYKFANGSLVQNDGKKLDSNISNWSDSDLMGLINDYRTGSKEQQDAIRNFLNGKENTFPKKNITRYNALMSIIGKPAGV